MALIAAGTFDSSGNFVDNVRSTNYAPEVGMGTGTTISDGGATRYIAESGFTGSAGTRIDIGSIPFAPSYTWAIRFIWRDNGFTGEYGTFIGRGSPYTSDTQGAMGMRAAGGNDQYIYGRSGSTTVGFETSAGPVLTPDIAYTLVGRWQSGSQQLWVCNEDIGGAGIDRVSAGSSTSNNGTDGSQNVFLGGPSAFNNVYDYSSGVGLLGALIYDEYINDATLDAIAADFYAQIPAAGTIGSPGTFRGTGGTPLTLVNVPNVGSPIIIK